MTTTSADPALAALRAGLMRRRGSDSEKLWAILRVSRQFFDGTYCECAQVGVVEAQIFGQRVEYVAQGKPVTMPIEKLIAEFEPAFAR